MDQNPMPPTSNMTGEGRLIFRVSTASGAIPLEGARIRLWNRSPDYAGGSAVLDPNRGDALAILYTDANGKTEPIALPAPPRSLSLTPSNGNTPSPFACYDADVYLDNFYSMEYICIPVFDGITSVQPADLAPLPENGREGNITPDNRRIVEGQNPNL